MTAICPKCQRKIPADDLNVATDVALCRGCDLVHKLSELIEAAEIAEEVDLQRPPPGTWYRRGGLGPVIGASHRSLGAAAGLLFFCLFWNGIVSVFVAVALSSTLRLLDLPAPAWFPKPIMNGGTMGAGITIGLWLFLTPFIAIGLAMLGAFLLALDGRTEITIHGGEVVLFRGLGPLGRRRRFPVKNVKAVRFENRRWRDSDGDNRSSQEIVIEMREGKPIKFGCGSREERIKFVAAALRKELKV